MKIPAAELKSVLKKLAPVHTEDFHIGTHGIAAKDSDVWVVVESPLSELGSFTVNGKSLSKLVGRMSGVVEITADELSITLRSAKAEVRLETKPSKPPVFPAKPEKILTLNTAEFKKAVSLAVGSASTMKSMACGGVVLFQTVASGIEVENFPRYRVAGTDEKVLTVATVETPLPFGAHVLLNLTTAGVVQLLETDTFEFGPGDPHYLKSGGLTVYATKPDQQYPGISPLLANTATLVYSFNPEEWLAAYRTVEPIIEPSEMENHVTLQFTDGVVQFISQGTGSTAKDEAGYEQVEPDPLFEPTGITLVMMADHLSGFLSKVSGAATLSFSRMDKPFKLESGGVQVLTFPRKGSKKHGTTN